MVLRYAAKRMRWWIRAPAAVTSEGVAGAVVVAGGRESTGVQARYSQTLRARPQKLRCAVFSERCSAKIYNPSFSLPLTRSVQPHTAMLRGHKSLPLGSCSAAQLKKKRR